MNDVSTFHEGGPERRSRRAEKSAQVRPDPDKQQPGILTLPDVTRASLTWRGPSLARRGPSLKRSGFPCESG